MTRPARVSLVGAGPGDPELITVRGLNALKSADVIIYDRLAPAELLQHAKPAAELINAGKSPGDGNIDQSQVNEAMIEAARDGKSVCRLKGGDPYVFGRGAEEAIALTAAGIPYEVIPGVTSALAAPASSGIPVTHRELSHTCVITTGSLSEGTQTDEHWRQLAKVDGTLVILMATSNIADITDALIKHGRPASEPAAATRYGTRAEQETIFGTLEDIAQRTSDAGLRPPVVFTFGPVVELAPQINSVKSQPLRGKKVVVTRARSSQSRLAQLLRDHGATVIETPAIRIEPLDDFAELDEALAQLGRFDWMSFASRNAVDQVFTRLYALGKDSRAIAGTKVAAIGPATVKELLNRGIRADLVPTDYSSDGLITAFNALSELPKSVLAFKSDIGRESVMSGLTALGATVDLVSAYRTVQADESRHIARDAYRDGVEITTFTSSSTVLNLIAMLDGDATPINSGYVASIGPITAQTAHEHGIRVDIVPNSHTIDAMVDAIVDHFAGE